MDVLQTLRRLQKIFRLNKPKASNKPQLTPNERKEQRSKLFKYNLILSGMNSIPVENNMQINFMVVISI